MWCPAVLGQRITLVDMAELLEYWKLNGHETKIKSIL